MGEVKWKSLYIHVKESKLLLCLLSQSFFSEVIPVVTNIFQFPVVLPLSLINAI